MMVDGRLLHVEAERLGWGGSGHSATRGAPDRGKAGAPLHGNAHSPRLCPT